MKDWAVILGASSGIGAECALRLAKKGINIYGVYYIFHIQFIDLMIPIEAHIF